MQATELVDVGQLFQLSSLEVIEAPFRNVLVSVKHQNIVRLVDWAETDIKEGRYGVLLLENCNKGYA